MFNFAYSRISYGCFERFLLDSSLGLPFLGFFTTAIARGLCDWGFSCVLFGVYGWLNRCGDISFLHMHIESKSAYISKLKKLNISLIGWFMGT